MFDIIDVKTFMDSVHGYISVPRCFVENLIDTEAFQRLRNIDQTGMRILYPDAKHDRFGHSLGVYHLGSKAVDKLLENFSKDEYWNISSDRKKIIFWAKNKALFLIACLLHDIGHAPFSHSLEQIILENSTAEGINIKNMLVDRLNEGEWNSEEISNNRITAAPHEIIGSLFILEHLTGQIEKIFDDLIVAKYPSVRTDDILYAEHYSYNQTIDKSELSSDICFIARMILGLKYEEYKPEKQIRNCFIELLNGSNFDVDKLDYVIRDTKMSGISNISIDIERLLGSLSIVTKTKFISHTFNEMLLPDSTLYSLSGSCHDNSLHITGTIHGTILLKPGTKVHIEPGSTFLSLKTIGIGAGIQYPERVDTAKFSLDTIIIQNGEKRQRQIEVKSGELGIELPALEGHAFDCSITCAHVLSENGFHFAAVGEGPAAVELQVNGFCNIHLAGPYSTKMSISFFGETKLDGYAHEITLIGNYIRGEVPNTNCYNEFSVGFKKQAINIIANVLDARDYLYLWIYSHHKVIYYANFLIPIVASNVLQYGNAAFPIWSLTYPNISYLDDSYVWSVVRHCRHHVGNEEIDLLCSELLGRKYKVSLFKSLAEYDLLFESFTEGQKEEIRSYFFDNYREDFPRLVGGGNLLVGYLCEETLQALKKCGRIDNISNIVIVDASYTAKTTDPHNTFIVMGTEAVTMDKIPLLADKITVSGKSTAHYFYLYYDTCTQGAEQRKAENTALKNAIKTFFNVLFQGQT